MFIFISSVDISFEGEKRKKKHHKTVHVHITRISNISFIWHKNNYNRVRKPQIDVRWMPVVGRAMFENGQRFNWIRPWNSSRICCKKIGDKVPKISKIENAGKSFNVLEENR